MIIFLSGPMTGLLNFNRDEFNRVAAALTKDNPNLIVLNPAILPDGMPYACYMTISKAMIDVADAVFALPSWQNSKGAFVERDYAAAIRKQWHALEAICPDLFDQPQTTVEK